MSSGSVTPGPSRPGWYAAQPAGLLTTALLSFHRPAAEMFAHADPMPVVPPPEVFASRDDRLLDHYRGDPPVNSGFGWPVEIRYIDREPWSVAPSAGRNRMWIRLRQEADVAESTTSTLMSAALLVFASDLTMFEPVIARHDIAWDELIRGETMFGATLDHSFWLHREFVFDDWLLHVQESTVAASGRGLTTGRFYARRAAGRVGCAGDHGQDDSRRRWTMSHIVRDWVSYHAARTPEAKAVTDLEKGMSFTWRELERRVGALAHTLRVDMNLRPGDRVAVIAENDARIFELQFACMRAGLILVPLNWRLTAHELTGLLTHAEPSALVHDAVWEAKADELAAALGITRRLAWECTAGRHRL